MTTVSRFAPHHRTSSLFGILLLATLIASSVVSHASDQAESKNLVPRKIVPQASASDDLGAGVQIADNECFSATTNGDRFQHGELMSIRVNPKKNGYIRIYGFDDAGNTVQIFPNPWDQDNKVSAGEEIEIPSNKKGSEYDLFVSVPEGKSEIEEFVQIIFSPEQFQDKEINSFTAASYTDIGKTNSESRMQKGLTPRAVTRISEKTYPYVVEK